MTQPRRMGVEGSRMRTLFVDAAEAILHDEGYFGISARQVASKAEQKTQLLYYYFRTMDDLILAVVQRINERRLQRFEEALAASDPIRALWELNSDAKGSALFVELSVIATHREAVRTEVVRFAEHFRELQAKEVERLLLQRNISGYSAPGIVFIASAISRIIVSEVPIGLTYGHKEAIEIVGRVLSEICPPSIPDATPKKSR